MEKIETPAVRLAFQRAKLNELTKEQLTANESDVRKYLDYTEQIEEADALGKAEVIANIVLKMLAKGESDEEIFDICGISAEDLAALKQ